MSRKRDRLKRKFNKSGNHNILARYKFFRNNVNNLKRHAKEQFYNNLEFSISDFHSNDRKQFWKVVRHFVKGNSSSSSIPPLNSYPVTGQNDFCFSTEDKAELLYPRHTKYVGVYSFRFSVRPFVRSFVRTYVRSFVRSSFRHRVKVFALKFIRPHILKTL